MHVRGTIRDLLAFKNLVPERNRRIDRAKATPLTEDAMGVLSQRLHPKRLHLKIASIKDETQTSRTFRLVPDPLSGTSELPPFQAGQYLSVKALCQGVRITRPYAISSAPAEAEKEGFYEITLRRMPGGFFTGYVWDNWKAGTLLETSGPEGCFCYEPLRDAPHIIGLAGGSGIGPFRSLMKDILSGGTDARLSLIYGTRLPDDIIFDAELRALVAQDPERLALQLVCSEPDESWQGPTGFLSAAVIRRLVGDVGEASFFLCGPPAMYRYLEKELKSFNLPPGRIRREAFGEIREPAGLNGFPQGTAREVFTLTVHQEGRTHTLSARGDETVLVALERANLAPPSQCRSGACGFCRSRLVAGEVYVLPDDDGRREADRIFGYFHPCASYPTSDLVIEVPPEA